jgi:hypothetical protein
LVLNLAPRSLGLFFFGRDGVDAAATQENRNKKHNRGAHGFPARHPLLTHRHTPWLDTHGRESRPFPSPYIGTETSISVRTAKTGAV